MQVDREEAGGDLWGEKAQGALGLSGWAHQILKNNTPNHKSMTMSNLPKPNTGRRNKHGEKMVMGRGMQGAWWMGIWDWERKKDSNQERAPKDEEVAQSRRLYTFK